MISVSTLLKMPDLKELKAVGGQSGLDREIKAVTLMDAPDSYKWLKGGELILTSGYMFGGDSSLLENFVMNLIEASSAGLCIKRERFLEDIPESVLKIAEQYNFPVIEIPYKFVWSDVISVFYELLYEVSENTFMPIEAESIEQVYRAGCWGSRQLLDTLTQLFQVPIAIILKNKKVLMDNGLPGVKLINRELENSTLFPEKMGSEIIRLDKYYLTVCPMPFFRHHNKEYLAVISQNSSFLKEVHKMFHLLAAMGSKENAVATDRMQIYREFMLHFISGRITQGEIQSFEDFRGTGETIYTGVLIINSDDSTEVYQLLESVLDSAGFQKKGKTASYLVDDAAKNEAVVMLELYVKNQDEVPGKWQHMLFEEMERGMLEMQESRISMGRFSPKLSEVLLSYREAREALTIGRVLWESKRCFLYSMVSVYSVLRKTNLSQVDLSDIELLENNRASLSFDAIQTLEAYIECGGYKKAAKKLYIHENTLRYRIQKIGEFLHVDMEDPMIAQYLIIQLKLWKSRKWSD